MPFVPSISFSRRQRALAKCGESRETHDTGQESGVASEERKRTEIVIIFLRTCAFFLILIMGNSACVNT